MVKHDSDSDEQREAELVLVAALSHHLGIPLAPESMNVGEGVRASVDGVNRAQVVICEAYAHIGKTKGGQPAKVAKDILKLLAIERVHGGTWRKILCLADDQAAACLRGRSWLASAAHTFGIEVPVIALPEDVRERVLAAQ